MASLAVLSESLPPAASVAEGARALSDALSGKTPTEVIRALHARFGDELVIAVSFGAEDMVLVHAASVVFKETGKQPRLITLDTGRLPEETHGLLEAARLKYGLSFEVYAPDPASVHDLVAAKGAYSFLDSVDARKQCCHVRKVAPLARALTGARVWITGLRRAQSVTRQDLALVEDDPANATLDHGLLKVSPLVSWSEREVWRFLDENQVPRHALHARGYPSIGCAPCTRAVADWRVPDNENAGDLIDIRAGRWWWEDPAHKECGLHAHAERAPSSSPKSKEQT